MLRLTLFGPFSLTDSQGSEIPLKSRKARALLAYLAMTPGKPRSREQIMALLWSERAEAQARGSLRQVLTGLRKDLGDAGEGVLRIDNESVALDPQKITLAPRTDAPFLDGFHLNDPAFEDWLRDERLRFEDTLPSNTTPTPGLAEKSDIAVLPFDNMSNDPAHELFSDGITEDIVTELCRFDELTVYSPWSSFHYKDDTLTTEEIGLDLEVEYVVEGTVRRVGDRVRITAALFDVAQAKHIWGQRFDRDVEDEFAVQDEVARIVATLVSGRIEAAVFDRALLLTGTPSSAYEYVLRGERAQYEDWGTRDAVTLYEQAIALDPDCARAYANLADWHASSILSHFAPFEDARKATRKNAEKAIDLQPGNAVNLAVLADAYVQIGDFDMARQCIVRATRLNPNHLTVMICAAGSLSWLGDVKGGQVWLDRNLAHDPLWQTAVMEVCLDVYYMAGRFDEAASAIARWTKLPIDLIAKSAAAHAQCGRLDEAADLRRRFEAGVPDGHDITDHVTAVTRMCATDALKQMWLDGYRKAGFAV